MVPRALPSGRVPNPTYSKGWIPTHEEVNLPRRVIEASAEYLVQGKLRVQMQLLSLIFLPNLNLEDNNFAIDARGGRVFLAYLRTAVIVF